MTVVRPRRRTSTVSDPATQLPPNPTPACRNFGPMRSSSPMPLATSTTSAPVSSQTLAISLMKEIFVARKALAASLTISAEAMSVRTSAPVPAPPCSALSSGRYRSTTASPAQSPSSPTTTRSGLRKSSIAEPSLRNSGQET